MNRDYPRTPDQIAVEDAARRVSPESVSVIRIPWDDDEIRRRADIPPEEDPTEAEMERQHAKEIAELAASPFRADRKAAALGGYPF